MINIFEPRRMSRQVCISSYPLSNMRNMICFVLFCGLFLLLFACP